MKKKILLIILIAIIAVIPTAVAIISYNNAMNNPVTRTSVSSLSVSTPSGEKYEYSKTASDSDEALFSLLFTMNENCTETDKLPTSDFVVYDVDYTSYNKVSTYSYYLTEDPDCIYLKNSSGKYFKVNKDAAGTFLISKYASQVYPQSSQPYLTVADTTTVLPRNLTWAYLSHSGKYVTPETVTSSETPVIDVSGGLQVSFDKTPDFISVVIKNNGIEAFSGSLEDVPSDLFSDNIVYTVELNAKWYEVTGCTYYGEATYVYTANVLSPAVFYISASGCDMGDFIVISAKNIVDASKITFVSEPKLYGCDADTVFTPSFFEYGGYYHALIPFSIYNETNNGKSGDYKITVSYGGVYQDFTVSVAARKISPAYLSYAIEKVNTYFTLSTRQVFTDTTKPLLTNLCTDIYWMEDSTILQPVSGRKIKYGFGLKMSLNATGETYWHEGVNYTVSSGDEVVSCLSGQVSYVGEMTLSGTTVIVEHGGGLKSLYAHMSSTSVKVGDMVEKGDILGIVGSTGFTTTRTLHFGLYVFDVPVRYYDYEENGIVLNEIVAKAVGLLADDDNTSAQQ